MVFEELIHTHFLDNPHRALVILKPDTGLGAKREAAEAARLAEVKAKLSPAELDALLPAVLERAFRGEL